MTRLLATFILAFSFCVYAAEEPPKSGMGTELKNFSEEVANRIDRIVKKKAFDLWGDPWTIQGIPLIFPSSDDGFNLGLRAAIQNIRRQDPHKFELELQMLTSDRGRYKHFAKIDYPRILDGKFRITARAGYDRDISLRYYGISNDTEVAKDRVNMDDPLYQNVRAGPSFTFQIQRYIGRYIRVGPTLGLKWTDITAPTGSLLAAEAPQGINGGRTHSLGLSLIDDNTDFEPYPSYGRSHEVFFTWYAPFLGSDYDFTRFTYTFRQYIPLHPQLIFAWRGLFEWLDGNIPFYELGAVGGLNPTLALGGSRFLRGYDGNRFIERIRAVLGIELRWDPFAFSFSKQDIVLGFVPFFDVGRVWDRFFPLNFDHLHASLGWGTRIIWNNRFILRSDVAVTSEGVSLWIDLGSSF